MRAGDTAGSHVMLEAAAGPIAGTGAAAAGPVNEVGRSLALSSERYLFFFSLRMLVSVEQCLVGIGQAPACCSDVCLLRIARQLQIFSKYCTRSSEFCSYSEVKFQSTGGAHCSSHLPTPSHNPCHPEVSCLGADLWVIFLNNC